MIEDYSRDLLRAGIVEFKAGNRQAARSYIDRALYMSSDHDVLAEGWYWMSELADDPAQKRAALENCLAHDLRHARARRALAILDGKLKPDEIIDPDAAPPAAGGPAAAEAQRFMCPRCGARMHFAADGRSLVCEHCTRRQSLQPAPGGSEASGDQDFLLAMATARGHGRPLQEQVFVCRGCGVQFFLPPGQLSVTCPYCDSPHVVSFAGSAQLLAPDAIIPHSFEKERAAVMLGRRLGQDRPGLRGLYVPAWIFDLGGAIDYTGEGVQQERNRAFGPAAVERAQVSDRYPAALLSLPIPASRKLSAPFVHLLHTYDLKALQPYDPRYLADWPAELYDISLAEASLDARSQGYARLKEEMAVRLRPLEILSTSSAGLVVDSFRLALLPVWVAEVRQHGEARLALLNGQTGDAYGGDPRPAGPQSGKLLSWLADLLGE